MTRARDELDGPLPFHTSVDHRIIGHFEQSSQPAPSADAQASPETGVAPVDLAAQMRAMWR